VIESTTIYRKPKKWIAAVLGLFIQPAAMLYVARPGWAAAYLVLVVIVVPGNLLVLRGRESAGELIALLVAITCAIHIPVAPKVTGTLP
jgi:signal peptidase I